MLTKTIRFALLALLAFRCGAAPAADAAQCIADLDDIARFMPANDAGASAELLDHGKAIDDAFQKARAAAGQAVEPKACEDVLRTYLRAWGPAHLALLSNEAFAAFTRPVAGGGKDKEKDKEGVDPRAPSFKVLDKNTVLFTFGTFDGRYKGAIEAMLKEHRAELVSHKHWIIDVRNNNGGSDSTYEPLLPWLLDGEYVAHNMEWLATPANVAAHKEICDLLGDRESCVKDLAPVVRAMQGAAPGTWVMSDGEQRVEYRRAEKREAHPPQRVAVLVDHACGSSCEEFLLQVRSSFRVKLLGRPSRGSLDYSNMRRHALASGERILMYTTSRAIRATLMPVDQGGVQPDVLLPKPADEAARAAEVAQVQRWLAGGSLRP